MFDDANYLDNVLDKPDIGKTKFTEWMKANDVRRSKGIDLF